MTVTSTTRAVSSSQRPCARTNILWIVHHGRLAQYNKGRNNTVAFCVLWNGVMFKSTTSAFDAESEIVVIVEKPADLSSITQQEMVVPE